MIIRYRVAWPLVFSIVTIHAQWFQPPAFDCSRIPQRWCCSPRVRSSCPDLCRLGPATCGPKPPPPSPFNSLLPTGFGLPLSGLLGGLPQLPSLFPTQPPPAVWNGRPPPQSPQPQGPVQPPPNLVLPPVGTPLAAGTGVELPELIQPPTRLIGPSGSRAVDGFASSRGNAAIGAGGSFGPEPKVDELNSKFERLPPVDPPLAPFATATPSTFPTLINLAAVTPTASPPSVAPPWAQTLPPSVLSLTTSAFTPSVVDANSKAKSRGILPPPNRFAANGADRLVELEEHDGNVTHLPANGPTTTAIPLERIDRASSGIARTLTLGTPEFNQQLPDIPDSSTQEPSTAVPPLTSAEFVVSSNSQRTTLPDGAAWSFRISPSKSRTFAESRDLPPPEFALTGDKRIIGIVNAGGSQPAINQTTSNGLFSGDRINTVINSIFTRKTIDTITNFTGKRPTSKRGKPRFVDGTKTPPAQTSPWVNASTVSPISLAQNVSIITNSQTCGLGPAFQPCVPLLQANDRLLQCCRSKLMPEGCLTLCRYDTTQAEVKKAFDAGKCGILNVAPFLDCASQSQDNRACCGQREIAKKSGPQCEVFCHPRDGLALGLQHLVCQNVISDLLQCHHSGLRFS